MTIIDYILPMATSTRVIFITYAGAELLDLTGPATVFNAATLIDQEASYECVPCSAEGGLVRHSGGLGLETRALAGIRFCASDTVLVVGALLPAIRQAIKSETLLGALKRASRSARRYGSICSGSFVLGAAGLIEGKTTATHWAVRQAMQKAYKNTDVDADSLYVNQGRLWLSAGVTTGIDMALAMVEEDYGRRLKASVAKQLVVYSHRPGNQSQFSQVLDAQTRVEQHFNGLVEWIMRRLDEPPKVQEMADFVGMTQRTFYRQFATLFDTAPGKFVERLRLDHARHLIEAGASAKSVAPRVGFRSDAAFRSAFKDIYGVSPHHYANMHRAA